MVRGMHHSSLLADSNPHLRSDVLVRSAVQFHRSIVAEVEAPEVICFSQLPGIWRERIFFRCFHHIKGFVEILEGGEPIQGSFAFRRSQHRT